MHQQPSFASSGGWTSGLVKNSFGLRALALRVAKVGWLGAEVGERLREQVSPFHLTTNITMSTATTTTTTITTPQALVFRGTEISTF